MRKWTRRLALVVVASAAAGARRIDARRSARRRRRTPLRHAHAHPASGRDLPGERLLRPLLRHVSERREQRRQPVRCGAAHAHGRRADAGAADEQPELLAAEAARQLADRRRRQRRRPAHLRPGSQLQRRAAGVRRREDGPVRPERRHRQRQLAVRPAVQRLDGHELLRRQHGHRVLELRAAVRDERQLVQPDLRPVLPGCDQPRLRQHRQRRHDAHGEQPVDRHLREAERRPDGRRDRRLLADERRAAVLGRLLDA